MTLTLLAALLVSDPDSAIAAERITELRSTLARAEEQWRSTAPTRYSYRLVAGGAFTRTTYAIAVNGDDCKARYRAAFGKKVTAWKTVSCDHYRIADIFAEIHRQLSIPQERIELNFDPEHGFPSGASFEPHSEIADQSEYFEISAFKAHGGSTRVRQ